MSFEIAHLHEVPYLCMCIDIGEHVLPLCPSFEEVPDHAHECVGECDTELVCLMHAYSLVRVHTHMGMCHLSVDS